MPTIQLRRYPTILQDLINRVVARTQLTDVTDVGQFKRFLASMAREFDEDYYQLSRLRDLWDLDRAKGEDLDRRVAELEPAGLVRLAGARSVGSVVFSRNVNPGSTVIIPAGAVVQTPQGRTARTTVQGIISNTSAEQIAGHGVGRDSIPVAAVAVDAGAAGNVATGSFTRFGTRVPGVDQVTNTAPFTQGRDVESDDELLARAKRLIATLSHSTVLAIEAGVIGVTDGVRSVVFSHLFEDPTTPGRVTVYIDDGAGTAGAFTVTANENVTFGLLGPPPDTAVGGEEFLRLDHWPIRTEVPFALRRNGVALTQNVDYFLDPTDGFLFFSPALSTGDEIRADYVYWTGLVELVQRVVNGDPTDPVNFPGYRAAGIVARVTTPTVVVPTIAGVLSIAEGFDRTAVRAAVQNAWLVSVNTGGISADVIRNRMIELALSVPGTIDINLTAPTDNITVRDSEIARITAANALAT